MRALGLAAAAVALVVPSALWVAASSAAPTSSVTLDQCTNGAVGPPLSLEQCAGGAGVGGGGNVSIKNGQPDPAGYVNWVNGNANGQKAHWQEGDFIPYRAIVDAPAGSHTLVIHYDTVKSKAHALDYLGSFDTTETTGTSASQYHANYDNPCADLTDEGVLSASVCPDDGSVPTPAGSATVPAADLAGASCAGGVAGTFTGAQATGSVQIFGPAGSGVGAITYVSQNVPAGGGQCVTTMSIPFTIGGSGSSVWVVVAWGGHIASAVDWGAGNSATGIQGSPYHMALDSLDGTTLGNQDRSLDSSAIFLPGGVDTIVNDAGGQPISSPIALGSVVHDTANLFQVDSSSGTLTYTFYDNATCDPGVGGANVVSTENVTVTGGVVPDSSPTAPLGAGSYGYKASFAGATSVCESFDVSMGSSAVTTTLHNAAGGTTIANGSHVPSGTSVYDTSTVTPTPTGFPLGGALTYGFFHTSDCSDTPTTQSAAVGAKSNATGTLAPGDYGFEATWSGDSNYPATTSACEPFAVDAVSTTTTTPATTMTTVPPAVAAAGGQVAGATTVHTGEPFAGSAPYAAAVLALGGSLLGLGLAMRRRVRAQVDAEAE